MDVDIPIMSENTRREQDCGYNAHECDGPVLALVDCFLFHLLVNVASRTVILEKEERRQTFNANVNPVSTPPKHAAIPTTKRVHFQTPHFCPAGRISFNNLHISSSRPFQFSHPRTRKRISRGKSGLTSS